MSKMSAYLFALTVIAAPLGAQAEDATVASRTVIEKQIDAFLKDDADTAYSFAAPGIKARYPDKAAFFEMVKRSYSPVYQPGNYAFGRSRSVSDGAMVVHEVLISGRDGKDWKALYQLLRQPDGTYRIGGVALLPETESKGI